MTNLLLPDPEQIAVYRMMLEALFAEIPANGTMQQMNREIALDEIRRGHVTIARSYARMGGIPFERLYAVEALIF